MSDMPEQKLLETARKYSMIRKCDNVMVCVSGGADSMALLSLFTRLQDRLGIEQLSVCHFNHGLRGAESDAEQQLVVDFCAKLGVECVCERGNMMEREKPKGESIESYARALRYDFFARAAARLGADKIAVAHNKNDLVETALFNIARGTGIKGARGMPPVRDMIIRPLIDVGREEIEQYCRSNGIEYATDSSNKSTEYARNRIRLNVMPELEKVNENALDNMARFCSLAGELSGYIEGMAAAAAENARTVKGYDIKCLLKNGELVAKYSLKHIIESLGVSPSENSVELCYSMINGGPNEVQLAEDVYLKNADGMLVSRGRTHIVREDYCFELKVGRNKTQGGTAVEVKEIAAVEIQAFIKSSKNILNNSIDYDKIIGNVVLRNRRDGDIFASDSRGNTKKVKKLFNERGIAHEKRAAIPIISDDGGILWIMGEGVSQRAAITAESKKIWLITVMEE